MRQLLARPSADGRAAARRTASRPKRASARGRLTVLLLLAATATTAPATAAAQVFLATQEHPEFKIGPVFIRASVDPSLGPVTVEVLWTIAVPPTRSALGLEQDLYLLWPAEIGGEGSVAGDPTLADYVRRRGFTVIREGQLPLLIERLYNRREGTPTDRQVGSVSFVSFQHAGLEALGVRAAASMIKIPWSQDLVNRVRLMKLRLRLDGALQPRRSTWLEELIRGPRSILSLSFSDLRNRALFPLYLENRARVIPLASDPSQMVAQFTNAQRLRIDEIYPGSATRQPTEAVPDSETVSVFLDSSEGAVPQLLTVQFGYTTRFQTWVPILIPVAFFVLGRMTGPLIERLARAFGRRVSAHLRFGVAANAAPGHDAPISRETLARIVPGRTTHDEVLALCGQDALEEQERLGDPERRTLVYRRRQVVPKRERRLLWLLSSVSDWELDEQEVEIALERGIVQDVQVRARRTRLPHPDTA
jgi:hypothetical protein